MTDYRRFYVLGATWFFTINLAQRKDNRLLLENIDLLRKAFQKLKNATLLPSTPSILCPTIFIAFGLYQPMILIIQLAGDKASSISLDIFLAMKTFQQVGYPLKT